MLVDDLLAFREAGASINVGLVDAAGHPVATRGFGLAIVRPSPLIVDVLLPEWLLSSLGRGPGAAPFAAAVTVSATRLFRSIQLKGQAHDVRLPTADDVARTEADTQVLFAALREINRRPQEALLPLFPRHLLACTVDVAEAYEQTPGPGAGRALAVPR